jgi:hypothetical protein
LAIPLLSEHGVAIEHALPLPVGEA